ncbi:hypothetical protein, partial [Bradyrhizobium uaiense]
GWAAPDVYTSQGYVWGGVLGAGIVVILKEVLQSYLPYIFGGQSQLETIVFMVNSAASSTATQIA